MPNVAEIIREHVTLDVKCVDRWYLNGYIPRLQSEGGVVAFLRRWSPGGALARNLWHDHQRVQGAVAGLVCAPKDPRDSSSPTARTVAVARHSRGERIGRCRTARNPGGVTDVDGVAYDDATRDLVIFGRQVPVRPPPNADDWTVAFQSVHAGEDPAVTIDPGLNAHVMQVRYFGPVENTHFGRVMFEADRLLKVLISGYENVTGARVPVAVPNFKTKLAML